MKSVFNGRRHYKPGEITKWIARYRSSGQSLRGFAKEHGLPRARLHYWVYQKSRSGSSSTGSQRAAFREVQLPELLGNGGWAAEIRMPQGTTVRVAASVAPEWIGGVLQQLSRPC